LIAGLHGQLGKDGILHVQALMIDEGLHEIEVASCMQGKECSIEIGMPPFCYP
jgi:hypothetical protein